MRKFDPDFQLLDMRFRYSEKEMYATFQGLGSDGRIAYVKYLALDYIFILCFLVVMIAIPWFIIKGSDSFRFVLVSIAFIRAIFDILENTCLVYLLFKFPSMSKNIARSCSWFTTFKFITLFIWIGALILYFLFGR